MSSITNSETMNLLIKKLIHTAEEHKIKLHSYIVKEVFDIKGLVSDLLKNEIINEQDYENFCKIFR